MSRQESQAVKIALVLLEDNEQPDRADRRVAVECAMRAVRQYFNCDDMSFGIVRDAVREKFLP
jgi:hypothetical protein